MYQINIRNRIVSQTRSIQTLSEAFGSVLDNFDLFGKVIGGSGITAGIACAINSTNKKYVTHLKNDLIIILYTFII